MTVPDFRVGFTALNRFGFGARGDGDLAAAASDPRGFLKAELAQPGIALLEGPGMPRTALALQAMFADQEQKKAERERMAAEAAAQPAMTAADTAMAANFNTAAAPPPSQTANKEPPKPPSPEQIVYRAEALARFQRSAQARAGLVERLVAFWANHFCVSVAKSNFIRVSAGAFEREAIRPHVLGRFSDMLFAVESHPAMLHYLDNQQSIGPNSQAGLRQKRAVTLALIDAPEVWTAPRTKMRTPYEFLVAAMRITGRVPEDPGALLHPLAMLGMPFWTPPGPNGFPDTTAAWASPEGMKLRLDVASQAASRLRDPPDPREVLDAIAGGAASEETRAAVARAETKQQGIALLLMSPEVQRR